MKAAHTAKIPDESTERITSLRIEAQMLAAVILLHAGSANFERALIYKNQYRLPAAAK